MLTQEPLTGACRASGWLGQVYGFTAEESPSQCITAPAERSEARTTTRMSDVSTED